MKTVYPFQVFCSIFFFSVLNCFAQTGYVTIQGRQFKDGAGNNFYPLVCNYVVDVVTPDDPNDYSNTFISPEKRFGHDDNYECGGTFNCNQQLLNDFNEILALGFNTVQIMGLDPRYHSLGDVWKCWDNIPSSNWTCNTAGFYIQTHPLTPTPGITDCSEYPFHPFNVNPPDATCQRIFEQTKNILEVASEAEWHGNKLKVILRPAAVCGPYPPNFDYRTIINSYFSYLMIYLQNNLNQAEKEALIGYDLTSEPGYTWQFWTRWPYTDKPTKKDVCDDYSLWYQTIKNIDPQHLITIGGFGDFDIFDFDPAILALDFYSFHIYPDIRPYELPPEHPNQRFIDKVNRVKGRYYWCKNNLSLPWIIGETGFRANDNVIMNNEETNVEGSEYQQQQYADETLKDVWKCNGSGYSWWVYQDYYNRWGYLSDTYFGILQPGDCPNDPTSLACLEKPVSEVFKNFITPTSTCDCEKPDNYYDPYNHKTYNLGENWVSGHVSDGNGHPIGDAFIQATTLLYDYFDPTEHKLSDTHYTYSNENGDFTIIPFDYDIRTPDNNTILDLRISAPGCSRVYTTGTAIENHFPGGTFVQSSDVSDVPLSKVYFGYDETIDWNIYPGSPQVFQSSNKLTFKDVTIYSGANCEGIARNEINLNQEFDALNGSETWLHLDPVSFPCDGLTNFPKKSTNQVENTWEDSKIFQEVIDLGFLMSKDYFDVNLYPNPGNGFYKIEIVTSNKDPEISCHVYDQFGTLLMALNPKNTPFSIDLSKYAKGIYFIQIQDSKNCAIKKIVQI